MDIFRRIERLTTPHLADASIRVTGSARCALAAVKPLAPDMRCAGRALPARHAGSVDVFLEAIAASAPGDVLVIDNAGRLDEGCIGDLITLEAQLARLAGIVVWGANRDTPELVALGLPVFSMGSIPTGPQRLDARFADALSRARVGDLSVSAEDIVVADRDGALFIAASGLEAVVAEAEAIKRAEQAQVAAMRGGRSLREQLKVSEFVARRGREPGYSFRTHLRGIQGAIEE